MTGKNVINFLHYILLLAILQSSVNASPVSVISKQVGLSEDVQVLKANATQDCELGGNIYQIGDQIKNSSNPCEVCYCTGLNISCSWISCPLLIPSEECKEIKEEGKCCPSYECSTASEVPEFISDQIYTTEFPSQQSGEADGTESILSETSSPLVKEADFSPSGEQHAVNSLFIHKVILESIKKEQKKDNDELENTTLNPVELTTIALQFSESTEESVDEGSENDSFFLSTTVESIGEKLETEEPSEKDNLIREYSEISTTKLDITTYFDPTERSIKEAELATEVLTTEDSPLNEIVLTTFDSPEQKEIGKLSEDNNNEYAFRSLTTEKELTELEESTSFNEFISSQTVNSVATGWIAETTEVPIENNETETSVSEEENLFKAAESVITSQTESYPVEQNSTPAKIYEEREEYSTNDFSHVTQIPEQSTEIQTQNLRSSDDYETLDEISTISKDIVPDESLVVTSTITDTEIPLNFLSVRSGDDALVHTNPSDEVSSTSGYKDNIDKENDEDLNYTFDDDGNAQASKRQKSELINVEEINRNDNEIAVGTTMEIETSTFSDTDITASPSDVETTTLILDDKETVTSLLDDREGENLFKSDILENNENESSTQASSEKFTTEAPSSTISAEDPQTEVSYFKSDLEVNSEGQESITETTTTTFDESEKEFVLDERADTLTEVANQLDEDVIPTTEGSVTSVTEDNWETTEIPFLHQESKILTKTFPNNIEKEDSESKIESAVKYENLSDEDSDTDYEEKAQNKTLTETDSKFKRKPQESSIHVFEKMLSNGSITRIETHSSEINKSLKKDRISTQFHHLARKYGLRPLTRKTFRDDVKNRRKYRLRAKKSLFTNNQ